MITADALAPETSFDRTRVLPFGTVAPAPYATVHALQERLLEQRIADAIPDTLLVGEHARVITLGRGVKQPENLVGRLPIDVVAVERGGQATWHGPGQLVAYPIVSLADRGFGVREYLRALEEAILATLAAFGIEGSRREGATGAWIRGERKVASVGVAIRRRVAWHGLALNVAPDLADFGLIDPCGFSPAVMTSMSEQLRDGAGAVPAFADVRLALVRELVRGLRLAPPIWEADPLATLPDRDEGGRR